jgi:hypothetical protein
MTKRKRKKTEDNTMTKRKRQIIQWPKEKDRQYNDRKKKTAGSAHPSAAHKFTPGI